jgi:hypothetical protein
MGRRPDKAFLFETPEHAAHQAGIEAEIFADFCDVGAAPANRIQQACGPERAAPTKKGCVQCADLEGDGAGEAAKTAYRVAEHII